MRTIEKVLKRKDASSVIVAVIIALSVSQVLPILTSSLANTLSGAEDGKTFSYSYPGVGWQSHYLQPIIWVLLQLVLLELILWAYTSVLTAIRKK